MRKHGCGGSRTHKNIDSIFILVVQTPIYAPRPRLLLHDGSKLSAYIAERTATPGLKLETKALCDGPQHPHRILSTKGFPSRYIEPRALQPETVKHQGEEKKSQTQSRITDFREKDGRAYGKFKLTDVSRPAAVNSLPLLYPPPGSDDFTISFPHALSS